MRAAMRAMVNVALFGIAPGFWVLATDGSFWRGWWYGIVGCAGAYLISSMILGLYALLDRFFPEAPKPSP